MTDPDRYLAVVYSITKELHLACISIYGRFYLRTYTPEHFCLMVSLFLPLAVNKIR